MNFRGLKAQLKAPLDNLKAIRGRIREAETSLEDAARDVITDTHRMEYLEEYTKICPMSDTRTLHLPVYFINENLRGTVDRLIIMKLKSS